ncbi:MAG: cell division protein FtsZ [Chloroflexota bacterium]|nr:cell division protein FtsZ [Chloroflexota bacterium]
MIFPDNSASWEPAGGFEESDGMFPEIGRGVPLIKVVGVGGGGSNAVSRMYKDKLLVVEYYALNTDAQHLARCDVHYRIALGRNLTRGLGAGAQPELGRQAAEESRSEIQQAMQGADMVFVAVGMGGGTGTGAAPLVAQVAKECGALTIAVVSRPFGFEAQTRRRNAEEGLEKLRDQVDTMIVIPNDRLLSLNEEQSDSYSWEDALKLADSVLHQGISAIAEVVTVPGEINVDFADVKTILNGAGQAWLSIGRGRGPERAKDAARQCTDSPMLDMSLEGARRILFVLTGGNNLSLQEVQDAAAVVEELADPNANIIFGTNKDARLEDEVKMTMVAADFPEQSLEAEDDIAKLLGDMDVPERSDYELPTFLQHRQNRRGFFR